MSASITALGKLGVGSTSTVDTALNFSDFNPNVTRELGDYNGTRGSLFKDGNRTIERRVVVRPSFSSEPTSPELATLLEWVMGGTPTGSTTKTYPWSNTALTKYVHYKPNAGEAWLLSGVGVNSATLRASSGEALSVDLDLLGQTYDDNPASYPTISYDQALKPFLLSHLVLTVGGVERKCREFSLGINNMLDEGRYLNSLTLTAVNKLGSAFNVSADVPSGDNSGLWKLGVSAACAFVATFTNPTTSAVLTISIADVRFPPQTPTHPRGGEGFLRVAGEAYRVGSADPITVTLNPGS